MSEPKRHHYIPAFILRNFAGSRGMLHYFSKRHPEKGVLSSTPRKLFVESNLYTEYDDQGLKDISFERELAALDDAAAPIVAKILRAVRHGGVPGLTAAEKATWDSFFYYQRMRVPDVFRQASTDVEFEEIVQDALDEFEATVRPLNDDERIKFKENQELARMKRNAEVRAARSNPGMVTSVLSQKGLGFAVVAKAKKGFVIGSLPVVKLTLPGRAHLADPSVEAWLPIAPDVAVTPAPGRGRETVAQIIDVDGIRRLNVASFKQSTLIAGRNRALVASLATRR